MSQALQPVIDAVKQGDRPKAIELIKQILSSNPNDIEALLVLAHILDEPIRKRQILNRVLSLAPTNKPAREMLLEMDRAEMSAYRPPLKPAPLSVAEHQLQPAAAVQQDSSSYPLKPSSPAAEKPLVFRPSVVWLVILYLFTAFFCCGGILVLNQSIGTSFVALAAALLFGLTALSLSSKIEVTGAGIRSSTLLGSSQIKWDDIARIKSNSMRKKLELVSNKGKSVSISTQVNGYPAVVEILRQKRPDLFGEARLSSSPAVSSAQENEPVSPTALGGSPTFIGTRTFRKSFFKQYGLLFALIPLCMLFAWAGFASVETRTAFFVVTGVCALFMLIPFFQVSSLNVEPDRLTVQTFFEEKEFNARQIREIRMQSVRGRYGRVTNFVNIIPVEGKKYPVSGFSEGEEIIYGFLLNWWNQYQSK